MLLLIYSGTDLKDQWRSILTAYRSSTLTDLIQDYDDYISNLADNMATKFVTAGMNPFQIVTDNVGESYTALLVLVIRGRMC